MDGARQPTGRDPAAKNPLTVLVLYDQTRPLSASASGLLDALGSLSRHAIHFAPAAHPAPLTFPLELFDVIALHDSVTPGRGTLAPTFAEALAHYVGPKALFLSDGPSVAEATWIDRLGINVVFTGAPAACESLSSVERSRTDIVTLPSEQVALVHIIERTFEQRAGPPRGHRFLTRVVGIAQGAGEMASFEPSTVFARPVPVHALPPLSVTTAPDLPGLCQGRLTLVRGVPLCEEDSAGNALYFTPHDGNRLALYVDGGWKAFAFYELYLRLDPVQPRVNYDVFVGLHEENGPLLLELVAWTDDTRRDRELAIQDGILVQNGAPDRRYLGTLRGSIPGCTEDTYARRFLWNHYHRAAKNLFANEMTCHEYCGAPRLWNADGDFHFEFVLGLPQTVGVEVGAFLRRGTSGGPARVHAALDGCAAVRPALGGAAATDLPHFLGVSTGGRAVLPAGYHHVGAGQEGDGLFANVWLRGNLAC